VVEKGLGLRASAEPETNPKPGNAPGTNISYPLFATSHNLHLSLPPFFQCLQQHHQSLLVFQRFLYQCNRQILLYHVFKNQPYAVIKKLNREPLTRRLNLCRSIPRDTKNIQLPSHSVQCITLKTPYRVFKSRKCPGLWLNVRPGKGGPHALAYATLSSEDWDTEFSLSSIVESC
jgi:hypothetical protein